MAKYSPTPASFHERGQELVEFALILPVLLLITIGVLECGLLAYQYNTIGNAAREGARVGVVCTNNDAAIEAATRAMTTGLNPSNLHIAIDPPGNRCRVPQVEVEVIYDANLISGGIMDAFGGDLTIPLRAVARMRME
jgi:hypothetical protein